MNDLRPLGEFVLALLILIAVSVIVVKWGFV